VRCVYKTERVCVYRHLCLYARKPVCMHNPWILLIPMSLAGARVRALSLSLPVSISL